MKVNALLNMTESRYGIDTLKFKNNSSNEYLFISLSSHESCHSSEGTYCTSKEEETSIYGLPKSLENCYGNTKETYDFVKNSTLEEITLLSFNELNENSEKSESIKIKFLDLILGERNIDINIPKNLKINIIE